MRNARATVILILAFGSTPGQAEIYKWVDEHGRIHYGDKPSENAETINVKEETVSTENSDNDVARREYRQRVLKSMQHERERQEEQRAQARAAEQEAKQRCAEARRRLSGITNAGFLYQENAQGERVIFTDEQRAQATAQAQAAVKRYCGN
ncbi:MAG TPA: DUF4124 domain-containing protein [Gammaproteobacteria bacterium]|jgi:hypothetical protein